MQVLSRECLLKCPKQCYKWRSLLSHSTVVTVLGANSTVISPLQQAEKVPANTGYYLSCISLTEFNCKSKTTIFFYHQPTFMLDEIFTLLLKPYFVLSTCTKIDTKDY